MNDKPVTLSSLRAMKARGEKIVCLTAYDAGFARVLEDAGVEVLLVGDSLGNVVQGHGTTLPVTLDDMVYHTACVARGSRRALVMSDLPFASDATPLRALDSAARLMAEGGAHMVKIEGGRVMAEAVRTLSDRGLPVCGHLGLLPQSVHKTGYRVQGRDADGAARLLADARELEEAGADMLLLECVPAELAAQVSGNARVPVIGIGAGASCDGQVLVLYDVLGITPGKRPSFAADFLSGTTGGVAAAATAYVRAVKEGAFPAAEHIPA
ncbi:MAG: 3-methyl-2-oxobutanoate hydroxymethyltransferase [Gammaproteobacteria bacterium]|jgi:3-methyl-2-oxobutanoate hydroxymethyltransferase|nr:3-methyl-2-oxobutanoate hydroxymethyltransferase [Gammaproteobacteria bacterium]